MKKDTHPDYHEISVEMTDGKTYKTRSTWGKAGDTLKLEIDPLTHPAWSKGTRKLVDTGGRLARFRQRFSGFGMEAADNKPNQAQSAAKETQDSPKEAPESQAQKAPKAQVES
ncbi:MAG: 50S ribosomal protein L31 [Alphaproteobacteria bacterium GM202ARS2]|nr:50S ribosomal protein L31 [Alphaproteobacteria bacterium GM202ARS2]